MKVFYYGPDNNRPSWGLGMIYYHVWLLNKNGINASIIHSKKPFKISWLKLDVPIVYLDGGGFSIEKDDVLVIPEFHASDEWFSKIKCKRIVFVQNAFYLFDGLKVGDTYGELGFDTVFYYLPHLRSVLQEITDLPLYETPPFIAPYYYLGNKLKPHKKKILVYPKFENRDYNILLHLLDKKLNLKPKNKISQFFSNNDNWQLIELENLDHQQVAEKMQDATFFISLNTNEAFNSAVPEAMAAGCINICYDGIGPRDFIKNEENAFVFANNDIFSLSKKIVDLVLNYEKETAVLTSIQQNGFVTADKYSIDNLETSLLKFFNN